MISNACNKLALHNADTDQPEMTEDYCLHSKVCFCPGKLLENFLFIEMLM